MEKTISHSPLGASTCHRWWECPGSVALIAKLPKQEQSFAAAEGTAAHHFAEHALNVIKTSKGLAHMNYDAEIGKTVMIEDHEIEISENMVEAVIVYINTIKAELVKSNWKEFLIEHPFHLDIDQDAWGTVDAMLYVPNEKIILWDYKHGKGTLVNVDNNKQLMYYALGAVNNFNISPLDIDEIITYIVQPRASHPDGWIRKCTYSMPDLKRFEIELKVKMEATRSLDAPLKSGTHCKFCPAIGDCPAVRAEAQIVAKKDFAAVPELSVEQMVKLLEMSPRITDYLKEVSIYLKAKAERGEIIKGFKLVKAKSNRVWKCQSKVIDDFKDALGDNIFEKRKLLSPAKLEKLAKGKIKKDDFMNYIDKPDKGLVLVPDSDPRNAVKTSASEDFNFNILD
tara:strand:- start:3550 stop:4740 length:1191 start_codon:yes stop_codon:yes gene_type:complete